MTSTNQHINFINDIIKAYPFGVWVGILLSFGGIISIINDFSHLPEISTIDPIIIFAIILTVIGLYTGYAAKLRGRSVLWGLCFGIGLIIISVLKIKDSKEENKN